MVLGLVCWLGTSLAGAAEPSRVTVAAWASGLMEVRVAFGRAVDPAVATQVVGELIGFGEGEKPGVAGRAGGDRGTLRIAAAKLVDDGRTLVLVTDPHPREATYRLEIPGVKAPGEAGTGSRLEVTYDLGGVEVSWSEKEGAKPAWSGWWPVLDPILAKELTAASVEHARLWPLTLKPGLLTLRTLVNLPKGNVSLALDANAPFQATLGAESTKSVAAKPEAHGARVKAESTGEAIELLVTLTTGEAAPPRFRIASGSEVLPRSAFVLPWAPPTPSLASPSPIPAPLLTGGDAVRGEAVFFGEQSKCANCHQVRGKGGIIGPDLSSLAGRDRAWVYQNIVEPSASIHPNYVSYTVALKDGRVAMGVVRAEGADAIKVGDIDAKQTIIPRADIEEIRPSASSIMPVGLLGAIGEDRTRDLLAYLTALKVPAR
jgi:putative heme-binding domain-containing protein